MKLLIRAVVGAVTLLSFTTASVLHHPTDGIKAPVPHNEDYDQYWELYLTGYQGVLRSYVDAFGLVKKLMRETEGFNSTVAQEVQNRFSYSINNLYDLYFEPILGEEHLGTPMPEVAKKFHERVVRGREGVATDGQMIKSLVEGERPELLPRLEALLALANREMAVAWDPTVAYLNQFLPGQ